MRPAPVIYPTVELFPGLAAPPVRPLPLFAVGPTCEPLPPVHCEACGRRCDAEYVSAGVCEVCLPCNAAGVREDWDDSETCSVRLVRAGQPAFLTGHDFAEPADPARDVERA